MTDLVHRTEQALLGALITNPGHTYVLRLRPQESGPCCPGQSLRRRPRHGRKPGGQPLPKASRPRRKSEYWRPSFRATARPGKSWACCPAARSLTRCAVRSSRLSGRCSPATGRSTRSRSTGN
jgi:hypothetical protein